MGVFELTGGKVSARRDYFDVAAWTRQTSEAYLDSPRSGVSPRRGSHYSNSGTLFVPPTRLRC